MQLLAMLDAAVQAASSGIRVEAILEVHMSFCAPILSFKDQDTGPTTVLSVAHATSLQLGC